MTRFFLQEEERRFIWILLLATVLHLIILIKINIFPDPGLIKATAIPLESTLNSQSNKIPPSVALHIAPQNHTANEPLTNLSSVSASIKNPTENNILESLDKKQVSLETEKSRTITKNEVLMKKRTISAATHESQDAAYLFRWQTYIEKFGNAHYPKEVLKKNLKGSLRLLVAIKRDGSVHEINLRQSSGSPLLDKAAIDIVSQAAPFEPLPPQIASEIEVLEIIRTWQFSNGFSTA